MAVPSPAERRQQAREGSFWRHLKSTHFTVIYRMQPSVVRLMLAWASLFSALIWTLSSVAGGEYKTIQFLVPLPVWSFAFFLHWLAVTWRIIDTRDRVAMALLINAYGLFLWIVSTIATALDTHGYPHDLAACIILCLFSGWALFRTGLMEEAITP